MENFNGVINNNYNNNNDNNNKYNHNTIDARHNDPLRPTVKVLMTSGRYNGYD